MTTEELLVSSLVPASPNRIFAAWMDERQHSAFTGGRAHIDPWVGGRVSAWDGYIFGNHLFLDTGRRIVMAWRTTDFPNDAPDSQVDVGFEPVAGGTKVSIHHTGIPAGQSAKYKEGWKTHYLEPMRRFFAKPGAMKAAIRAAVKGGLLSQAAMTASRPTASRGAHNVFASDAPPPFTGVQPPAVSPGKLRLARLREERAARDAAAAAAAAKEAPANATAKAAAPAKAEAVAPKASSAAKPAAPVKAAPAVAKGAPAKAKPEVAKAKPDAAKTKSPAKAKPEVAKAKPAANGGAKKAPVKAAKAAAPAKKKPAKAASKPAAKPLRSKSKVAATKKKPVKASSPRAKAAAKAAKAPSAKKPASKAPARAAKSKKSRR